MADKTAHEKPAAAPARHSYSLASSSMHSAVASGVSVAASSAPGALLRRHAEGQRQAGTSSKASGTTPAGTDGNGSTTVRRSGRLPKKRTVDAAQFEPVSGHSREGKMLKLALAKSIVETKLVRASALPRGAVFYPTRAQFADPIKYISSIEREAARTGICKIVPPSGWKPPFAIDLEDDSVHFGTRKQKIHELQEGHAYDDGRSHTFKSYRDNADAFRRQWFGGRNLDPNKVSSEEIEQEYWRIVESGAPNVEVEYANDLDISVVGSGFPRAVKRFASQGKKGAEKVAFEDPEYYRNTGWNLNNLPDAYGSLLRHLGAAINGINVPWLYCGMLFASFCWHAEDNFMSSINYQHCGAKKRWYGIPSSHSEQFERTMRAQVPERFRENPDLLLHLTTMVPPSVLQAKGVKVFTLVQEPGDIILTFPKAYHSGFSEGFNCNEAVNFVLPTWLEFGRECVEMYRTYGRLSIFSHDRFVFHFGSTQNLNEYTISDCEMLLKELRRLFHEEQDYKKAFIANGLESVEELSGDVMLDERSMEVDDVRQCFLCKHNVFFSGVICSCNPNRLSCLRHTKAMCSCPMQKRTLLQWVSSAELRYAIRRVQVKTRALKSELAARSGDLLRISNSSAVPIASTSDNLHGTSRGNYFLTERKEASTKPKHVQQPARLPLKAAPIAHPRLHATSADYEYWRMKMSSASKVGPNGEPLPHVTDLT